MVDVANLTNATVQQVTNLVQPMIQTSPGWVQTIGKGINGVVGVIVPQQYLWLTAIVIAIVIGGLVVRKLRQGVLTFTALWVITSIMAFMALKYVGL